MADDADVTTAFQERCEALIVAQTGLISLSSTLDGYTRTVGSFKADGFRVGLEVNGLAGDKPNTILDLTDTHMLLRNATLKRSAAAGRSLTAGLPARRSWGNFVQNPNPTEQFVEGELKTQPGELVSMPAAGGTREDRGIFVVRWFGLSNTGDLGLKRGASRLLAKFTPGTTFLADTDIIRMRGDYAANYNGPQNRTSGHALMTFALPYRIYRENVVVA